MKTYITLSKLQKWSITIRGFSVLSMTLGDGSHPSAVMQWLYSIAPTEWIE